MALKDKLKSVKLDPRRRKTPLWNGPYEDGITFSMLSQFLMCRERFRIQVIDGWKPLDRFNHRIEYGNLWHACEEACVNDGEQTWRGALLAVTSALVAKYRMEQDKVLHWYQTCLTQFDSYLRFWDGKPVNVEMGSLVMSEQVFRVPYRLPSGKTPILAGKWDGLRAVSSDPKKKFVKPHVKLAEHKTKGDIDEYAIQAQLKMDLQTMLYYTALRIHRANSPEDFPKEVRKLPLTGVLYNVVRRPFSGGKGNITRHKAKGSKMEETEKEFYARFKRDYLEAEPDYWFKRWDVPITPNEGAQFEAEMLVPLLEEVCDWWERIPKDVGKPFPVGVKGHWRAPYVYNPMSDGQQHFLDEYMQTGSTAGLEKATTLFPELQKAA